MLFGRICLDRIYYFKLKITIILSKTKWNNILKEINSLKDIYLFFQIEYFPNSGHVLTKYAVALKI